MTDGRPPVPAGLTSQGPSTDTVRPDVAAAEPPALPMSAQQVPVPGASWRNCSAQQVPVPGATWQDGSALPPELQGRPAAYPRIIHGGLSWIFAVLGVLFAYLAIQLSVSFVASLVIALQKQGGIEPSDLTLIGVLAQVVCLVVGYAWFRRVQATNKSVPVSFKGRPDGPVMLDQLVPTTIGRLSIGRLSIGRRKTPDPQVSGPKSSDAQPGPLRRLGTWATLTPSHRRVLKIALLILLGIAIQGCISSVLTCIATLFPGSLDQYSEAIEAAGGDSFLDFVSLVFLAPLSEEVFFRGVIFEHSRRIHPDYRVAIVVQGTLFGIAHLNLVQGSYTVIMGIVFGVLALRAGGLRATILVHASVNLSSYIVDALLMPFFLFDVSGLVTGAFVYGVVILLLVYAILRLSSVESAG